jgi:hypothetical protein
MYSFSCSFPGRSLVALLVVVTMPSTQAPADERSEPGSPGVDYVRIPDPTTAWAVRRAVQGASRYLEMPECQRVFSDFADRAGRPLQEALDAQAKTGPAFLNSLLFYDGSHQARCRLKQTYAVASPGSRVVFVCTTQFQEIAMRKARLAQVILIHEALHALGLGENPPTSAEITNRVMNRCLP